MRDVLAICREHGQGPGWFDTLAHGEQVLLLADYGRRAVDGRL